MLNNSTIKLAEQGQDEKASSFTSGAKVQYEAVGSSGTEIYAGYFSEEYLATLHGKEAAEVWDKMRRSESQVAMLMNAIMNPIKAADWSIEPYKQEPEYIKHAELMKSILFDGIDFDAFKQESLSLIIFGFSAFEPVHCIVFNHPEFGTFNGLKALAFRSQKTIESWKLEKKTGKILWIEQIAQGDIGEQAVRIPGEFLLVFSNNKEGDNYEGISALRAMYGAYIRKQLYLKLTAIGVEKNAVGTPIGTVPASTFTDEDFKKFTEVLKAYTSHEKAYITVAEGWKVEIQKVDFDADKMVTLLTFENTEMINAVVANFLALGTNGGGGAFALSTDLSDFFTTGIQSYADIITGGVNRKLIPDLVKLNFGPQAGYPKLKVSGISDKAGKELADVVRTLTDAQAIKPDMPLEEFLRRQYKMPKADVATSRDVDPPNSFGAKFSEKKLGGPGSGPQGGNHNGFRTHQSSSGWKALHPEGYTIGPFKSEDALKSHIDKFYADKGPRNATLGEPKKNAFVDMIDQNKEDVKVVMQDGLTAMGDDLKKKLKVRFDAALTDGAKVTAASKVEIDPELISDYEIKIRNAIAKPAALALRQAANESTNQLGETLLESIKLAAPKGAGFYNALPPVVKRIVETQAALLAASQPADIEKIVTFQYSSSNSGVDNYLEIESDIDEALKKTINGGSNSRGMSVDAAAGDVVAHVANQARTAYFFDPEVLNEIESFTFENNDPVSVCCKFFDGTTFAADDPRVGEFTPPLHHNCKSRMKANLKGTDAPKPVDNLEIPDDVRSAITL